MKPTPTHTPNKILIVGPAWVGDMIMSQSLYRFLRKQNPNVTIDVLAPNASGSIVSRMPEVRRFIPLPVGHGELKLWQRYQIGRQLREEKYDQAIVLPNSFKSALIPFFANIPIRTGWLGEMRYGLLNDCRRLDKTELPFMVERFVALAYPKNEIPTPLQYPYPQLQIASEARRSAEQKHPVKKGTRPIIALCPGAEYGSAKQWPAAYFAKIGQSMQSQGWDVWIFGGSKDTAIATEIAANIQANCTDLSGKTTLTEAADLLSLADLVVSNDSGLMHVAASLLKPLVVIYGSSDPGFTPPLAQHVKILTLGLPCSPCFERECPLEHLRCLRDLTPARVLKAITELMHTIDKQQGSNDASAVA